jgi:hypothetical protein
LLLFLRLVFVLLPNAIVCENPDTDLAKKWWNVLLKSFEEVSMIKMENLFYKVFSEDTNHPDLLILHETNWSLIKTISAESL